jgi:GTP cyclohydrolase IA
MGQETGTDGKLPAGESKMASSSSSLQLEQLGRQLLAALGEDPDDPRLKETPRRWAGWWHEFLGQDSAWTNTTFDTVSSGELVVVSGLRIWSICEHHLLPFETEVAIGYLPADHRLGLSKFARAAWAIAHRLQLQERLTQELADAISSAARSGDVAVLVRGRHLCVEARGVRTPALVSSLVARGRFDSDPDLRRDFLALAGPAHSLDKA